MERVILLTGVCAAVVIGETFVLVRAIGRRDRDRVLFLGTMLVLASTFMVAALRRLYLYCT